MSNIQTLIEAFITQHAAPSQRPAARTDLHALVNAAELSARRDEIERGLEVAAAREEARR